MRWEGSKHEKPRLLIAKRTQRQEIALHERPNRKSGVVRKGKCALCTPSENNEGEFSRGAHRRQSTRGPLSEHAERVKECLRKALYENRADLPGCSARNEASWKENACNMHYGTALPERKTEFFRQKEKTADEPHHCATQHPHQLQN